MMRYNGAGSGPMPPRSSRPSTASEAWPGERAKVMAVRASAATIGILVVRPPRDFPMAWGPRPRGTHSLARLFRKNVDESFRQGGQPVLLRGNPHLFINRPA